MPANITLLPLPARSPKLNPVENLWQFMRDNWLGNRTFTSYADILDHCCHTWNTLINRPGRIMSIGKRAVLLRMRKKPIGANPRTIAKNLY